MGKYLLDQYSYLHFASGIIAYFWKLNFKNWLLLHSLFEFIENTTFGMSFINNLTFWPGGKPNKDTFTNIIGDTISTIIGWVTAYLIDDLGNKFGLYKKHI